MTAIPTEQAIVNLAEHLAYERDVARKDRANAQRKADAERDQLHKRLDRAGVPCKVQSLDPLTLESCGDEPGRIRDLGTHERELTTLERLDMLLRDRVNVAVSVGGACQELMHALEDPRSGVGEPRLATEDELAKATVPIGTLRRLVSEACRKLQQEREAHRITRTELEEHVAALDSIRGTCARAGIPEETTDEHGTTRRWSTPHLVERLAEQLARVDKMLIDQIRAACWPERGDLQAAPESPTTQAGTGSEGDRLDDRHEPQGNAGDLRDLLARVRRQAVDAQYRAEWAEAAKLLEQERLILADLRSLDPLL